MEKEYKYLLYTRCLTFNHATYIVDAMNGFTMQETTFPVVTCIVDDASTDGEQEVIRQYLLEHFQEPYRTEETDDYNLICANHNTNPNCIFVVFFLKYNHHNIKKSKLPYLSEWLDNSKYHALCEGDDYWVDPFKLQKQVDFMENHPNHSLCFCAHENLYPSGIIVEELRYKNNLESCPMDDIIIGGGSYMATCSMLYRYSMYEPYQKWAKDSPVGDIPIMLTLAKNGLVGYLSDVMCVYRKLSSGSWNQRMISDYKKRCKHYYVMLNVFDMYDKYTGYQYHNAVLLKKRKYKKQIYKVIVKTILDKVKSVLNSI